jgi:SNF2 family DNA or RNA helicase
MDNSKQKLRNRIKIELTQDEFLDDDAKLRLVEILEDMEELDSQKLAERNAKRKLKHEQAQQSFLEHQDMLLKKQENRDQKAQKQITEYVSSRDKHLHDLMETRQQRTMKAAQFKALEERRAFKRGQLSEQAKQDKYNKMLERKEEEIRMARQKIEQREQRHESMLKMLNDRNKQREETLDVKAYEKDISMEMANARRQQQIKEQKQKYDEKRDTVYEHSMDQINELKKRIELQEQRRLERLKENEKERNEKCKQLVSKHQNREKKADDIIFTQLKAKEQQHKDEAERRRRKEEYIMEKKRMLEDERRRRVMETDKFRVEHIDRVHGRQFEDVVNKTEGESKRRVERADRFFRALGIEGATSRNKDYMSQSSYSDHS